MEEKLTVAQNIAQSRVLSVNFGGGEPLLSKDTLPVIRALASAQVITNLSTNGWYVDEKMVQELCQAGLSKLIVSLDDARETEHDASRGREGSYDAVLQALQACAGTELPVALSVVLTRKNFDQLSKIIDLAEEYGCVGVELKRLRLQGAAAAQEDLELSSEQVKELYQQIPLLRKKTKLAVSLVYNEEPFEDIDAGCPCGRTSLALMSDGTLAACVYSPTPLGNALTESISSIWKNSPQLQRMRTSFCCVGLI